MPANARNLLSNPQRTTAIAGYFLLGACTDEHYQTGNWRQEFFILVTETLVIVKKLRNPV